MNHPEFGGTDRFEIVRRLGAGGMGVVYEALDRERRVRLALKTLRSFGGHDLLQFKREFRALQDVQHPNLISLGELYEHHGQWFFTMELVRGEEIVEYVRPMRSSGTRLDSDLTTTCARVEQTFEIVRDVPTPAESGIMRAARPPQQQQEQIPIDEQRLRMSIAQLAQALVSLHGAGKVHRDIKPSNILVTPDGRVVLLDFGLVADLAPDIAPDTRLAGTIPYMAPEAMLNAVGPAADWYAVGVLLYEMLTSALPFEGHPASVLFRKQKERPKRPSELVPGTSDELDALCMDLLEPDPARRPPGVEVLRRIERRTTLGSLLPPPSCDPIFIGRRAELEALRRAWNDVRDGRTVTTLVHGESGIGKSALVRRFVDGARAEAVVLSGRCYEREAVRYKAVDGVVDALSQHLASLSDDELAPLVPPNAGLLPQMFPVLRRIPAFADSSAPDSFAVEPHIVRLQTFAVLREVLCRLAERKPLLVTIDDLQWADADSRALLDFLLGTDDAPPMLLVATMRTGRGAIALPGDVRDIALGPLDDDDAMDLARLLVERTAGRVDPSLLATEASGHPMFIDELARHLRRKSSVPDAVRLDDVLRERVRALPEDARRLLEILALVGTPLDEEAAARAALSDPSDFHRCLAILRGANLARGAETVETNHDRIREAVMAGLEDEQRQAHALRLAAVLAERGNADPEVLAGLFHLAKDDANAIRHTKAAAVRALGALAFDRAATLYRRAIDLGADDLALFEGLAEALVAAGRGVEAARAFLAAAARAEGERTHVLRRRAAEELLRSGHIDEGLEVLDDVLETVGLRLPQRTSTTIASLVFHQAKLALRKYSVRRSSNDALLRKADAAWSVAAGLSLVDLPRAADFQSRAMLYALDTGEPRRLTRAFAMSSCFLASDASTRTLAAQHLARAEQIAPAAADAYSSAWLPLARAMLAFGHGRFREALIHADEALVMFRDRCRGVTWEITSARSIAFWSLGYLGWMRELAARVAELLEHARERGDRYAAINVSTGAAHLMRLAADDPDGSRRESARAIETWSRRFTLQHAFDLFTQAETLLYEDRPELGLERLEQRWGVLRQSLLFHTQAVRIFVFDLRGRLELACAQRANVSRGSRARLLRACAKRADALERERITWADGMAAALRAGITRDGDHLVRAARMFRAAEMTMHVAAAEHALGERACLEAMREEGIVDVPRFARMLVPARV